MSKSSSLPSDSRRIAATAAYSGASGSGMGAALRARRIADNLMGRIVGLLMTRPVYSNYRAGPTPRERGLFLSRS